MRTYNKYRYPFHNDPCNLLFMRKSYLTQGRFEILQLKIEFGRWSNKEENEIGMCLVCNEGQIENEKQFYFSCTYYTTERMKFAIEYKNTISGFINMINDEKLKLLMSKEQVQEFSQYLYKVY